MESGIITKRNALSDITNEKCSPELEKYNFKTWFPIVPVEQENSIPVSKSNIRYQNMHPVLPSYKYDLHTTTMSHDQLSFLLRDENEAKLVKLLQDTGVFAKIQNYKFCGGNMQINQMKTCWYKVCYRRVNGIKCNRGKQAMRKGTFFDNSKLSIQQILWIVWHFVHHLSEQQCKHYTNIGPKNNNTVVKWNGECRRISNAWIWKHPPKLGVQIWKNC